MPGARDAGDDLDEAWLALSTGELARFIARPEGVIADYRTRRAHSDLAQLLAHARRLAQAVDRLIVVAEAETLAPLRPRRGLLPSVSQSAQPGRAGRQPRIELAGDAGQRPPGGTHRAGPPPSAPGRTGRILGAILIGGQRESDTLAAVSEVLLAELTGSTGGERKELRERSVSIAPIDSPSANRAYRCGVPRIDSGIATADEPGEVTSIFSIAGLLTAATLGIDVRRLLEGAAQLNAHFRARRRVRIWCCDLPPRAGCGKLKVRPAHRGWWPRLPAWKGLPAGENHAAVRGRGSPARLSPTGHRQRHDRLRIAATGEGSFRSIAARPGGGPTPGRRRAALAAGEPWAVLHVPQLTHSRSASCFSFSCWRSWSSGN